MNHGETQFLSRADLLQRLSKLEQDNRELRARLQKPDIWNSVATDLQFKDLKADHNSLRISEGWLRALVESATDYAIITLDLTGRITSWNSGARNILGWEESEVIGRYADFFFTPEDRKAGEPEGEMRKALAEGRAEDERWHLKQDGSSFWAKGALMPFRDSELLGFLKILRDHTNEKYAVQQLNESEEQLREILESISDAFYAVDRNWRFTYVNRKAEEWWGRKREDLLGKSYPETFPQIIGSDALNAHIQVMEGRKPVHFEVISPILHHWVDGNIYPTADGGLSVYFRDITERKKAEEHQRVLLHELNHRVKNTLATVQSIASQTLRNANTPQETKEALESRLFALSRAHDVLTRENWEAASLHEIVAQAIEPYRIYGEERIQFAGPSVRIPPRMALALAMAFQELATNAVKYGALHNEHGQIGIRWVVDGQSTPPCLRLRWEESGGPSVKAPEPERRGFGTRLIERSLAHDLNGSAQIKFAPTGLVCEITAPLLKEGERHSEM
jgi:PAS domain S-box-containing protein